MRVRKQKDRFCEYYGLKERGDHKVCCPLCGEIVNFSSQNVYETCGQAYHTMCLFASYQKIVERNKEDKK